MDQRPSMVQNFSRQEISIRQVHFGTDPISMNEYLVSCVTRNSVNPQTHEQITHIGGVGTTRWRLTKESAVRRIEGKQEAFYTLDASTGRKIYIGVVRETAREPYLRTYADGKWNDNLLAQPDCPPDSTVIE